MSNTMGGIIITAISARQDKGVGQNNIASFRMMFNLKLFLSRGNVVVSDTDI